MAPGQITDDTELALAQAEGLIAGAGVLDLDLVAASYRAWYTSAPFDVGVTCRTALDGHNNTAFALVSRASTSSKSNGAAMRATPLGVWASRLSAADAFRAGALDAALTHPSVSGANGAYVCAIAHLVSHPGDAEGAVAAAETQLEAGRFAEPLGWLRDAKAGVRVPYTPLDGFVKIAFIHAFRHLCLRTPFRAALAETLAGGGDTDTNAAIVCGLLGALHGAGAIDVGMVEAVTFCNTGRGAHRRPAWLSGARLPALAEELLGMAPRELVVLPEGIQEVMAPLW